MAIVNRYTSDIRFNQSRNTVNYSQEALTLPFITANKLLHSLLINSLKTYVDEESNHEFTDVVCREMMKMTFHEIPSIDKVASTLSVSTRTLRRRLMDEGITFQKVRQLALERRSKYLLRETRPSLAEIAYEMGYSEDSAFNRAFRGWTGCTPQLYRKEAQGVPLEGYDKHQVIEITASPVPSSTNPARKKINA